LRLTRLVLERYGHLADVDIVFDPAVPLHIVLGANEAGKSTALSAIADAMFGFPNRTAFAFLHRHQDLRLGLGVQAADGRAQFFRRRKGNKDTLRDADDAALPESAIASFLAGASRERFLEIFGMDGAELRRGGAAILEGRGEIGQSIVQAHTGLLNVRGALNRLNEDVLKLYGDKRGGRDFHVAAEAFRTARQDLETRSVRPAEYDQAAQERADIVAARMRNATESEQLEGERARLDRIRRTTPARLAFLNAQAERASLGELPSLPEDAEAVRVGAVQRFTALSLELSRTRAAQEEDETALQSKRVDQVLLAEADGIDAVVADLSRIEGAVRDREAQRFEAAQAGRRVEEQGGFLGLQAGADSLGAMLPSGFLRAEAERAIKEHTRLSARRQDVGAGWEQAENAVQATQAVFASLAAPEPIEALVAAIEVAIGEGRIDEACDQAEDALEAARASLARAMQLMPFWPGDAHALAAARMPLAADVAAHEAAFAAAEVGCAERQREVRRLSQSLQALEADLAGVLAAGAPPTVEAVLRARARRDTAWRLIRALHIEQGPAPAEIETGDLPQDVAEAFPGLMGQADTLADRRTAEAERVATYEQLRANRARVRLLHEAETAALETASGIVQQHHEAWRALWQPAGIAPGDPAQMRVFLQKRDAVLSLLEDEGARARQRERLWARRDQVWQSLAVLMPEPPAQVRVAPLLQAASLRRKDAETRAQAYAEAKRSLGEKERALAEQARKRQSVADADAAWQSLWGPIAASLGLSEGAGAEAGAQALAIWAEIDRHAREMRSAHQRIGEMTAEIEIFSQKVAGLCASCAPALAAEPVGPAVRHLAGRLALSRAAAAERAKLQKAIEERAANLSILAQDIARAGDELAALRAVAGVHDDEALQHAIARAHQAALLERTMAERARELHAGDDGLPLAALAQEADGEDGALLPARIATIVARKSDIAAENEGFASRLRDLDTRIAAMERGHDASEAAQRMRDAAAEAEDIAARYVRLRLSHSLLRAGVERFRREKQAPLLAASGRFFTALTDGRYEQLALEEAEDGKMVVVALRPDGLSCPAERLSEGARDQLYLALRLAAIASHAAQTEPLPFIADDLLASFDDARAQATLRVLAEFGAMTQTILFTHHEHIAGMADPKTTCVHRLRRPGRMSLQ
jgi:chromosome segregation protein